MFKAAAQKASPFQAEDELKTLRDAAKSGISSSKKVWLPGCASFEECLAAPVLPAADSSLRVLVHLGASLGLVGWQATPVRKVRRLGTGPSETRETPLLLGSPISSWCCRQIPLNTFFFGALLTESYCLFLLVLVTTFLVLLTFFESLFILLETGPTLHSPELLTV